MAHIAYPWSNSSEQRCSLYAHSRCLPAETLVLAHRPSWLRWRWSLLEDGVRGGGGAKAAVLGLTRGAARELGPHGITCNAVVPGPIDTDIMGGPLSEDRKAALSGDIPVQRVGRPSEVAAPV